MAKEEAARETEEKKKQEEKRKKEEEKKKRKSQSGGTSGAVVIPEAKSPKSPSVPQSPRSPVESPGIIPPPSPYKTPGKQESEIQEAKVDMHAENEENDIAYRGLNNHTRQHEPPKTIQGGITVTTPTRPQYPEQINRSSPQTEPSITINGRTIPQERPTVLNGHIATGQALHGQQVIMNSNNRQSGPQPQQVQIGHQQVHTGQGHQRDSAGSSSQGSSRRSDPRTPSTPVSPTTPIASTSPTNGQRPTYQRAPSQESKRSSASGKASIDQWFAFLFILKFF